MSRAAHCCACALLTCLLPLALHACSVPVFNYALRNWEADRFSILIVHRGELSAEHGPALTALSETAFARVGTPNADIELPDIDRNDTPADPILAAVWAEVRSDGLPRLALAMPDGHGCWSAPLSLANAQLLLTSPTRTAIAERLLSGESVVWLLLRCGDAAQDRTAEECLRTQIAAAQPRLTLPVPDPNESPSEMRSPGPALRIALSVIAIDAADDPVLTSILRRGQPPQREPEAYPVFGRGRCLPPLPAAALTAEAVLAQCQYLCGACSCQIKAENPGEDLLLAMDWDQRLVETANAAAIAQAPSAPDAKQADTTPPAVPAAKSAASGKTGTPPLDAPPSPGTAGSTGSQPAMMSSGIVLLLPLLLVAAVIFGIIAASRR